VELYAGKAGRHECVEQICASTAEQEASEGRSLKILFGEFTKLVGNGTGRSQRHRPVSDRLPSESIADPVNGAVGHPTRHASFGAGPALLIFKPKWEFQLNVPVIFKVRHGDRQERDGLLVRVILADRVGTRLRAKFRPGRTVTVRVRFADLRSVTRSVTLDAPISATAILAEIAEERGPVNLPFSWLPAER
jgi:hypothetical protein